MISGEWTHHGTAQGLRDLSVRLKATGQTGLRKNMTRGIVGATKPARVAVKEKVREVMPHGGGADNYLAKMPVRTAVLTGPKTAGVVIRARRKGSDLRRLNAGLLRHPTRMGDRFSLENRDKWRDTPVPEGWWEDALHPFDALVLRALTTQARVTAREAGFE